MNENKHHIVILENEGSCCYVAEALRGNTEHAIDVFKNSHACLEALLSKETKCNLVITCVRSSSHMGLELIKEIRATRPSIPIIVLAAPGNPVLAFKTLKLGVHDYIEDPVNSEHLISSVNNAIASHSMEHLPVKSLLSKVEFEVLSQILRGQSAKQIALNRNRSIRTIEDHRSSIMKKLRVDNVVDLVKRVAYVVIPSD